jgi:ribosome-associated toxin RatA of RatAB toxin-antitoxin module
MHSTLSIDVEAPPELVFRLAERIERWPAMLPHYVAVDVLERTGDATIARMMARRPLVPVLGLGLPVAWRARAWAEPTERRLRFHHLGGATAGMDVTWRIEPAGDGRSRVTLEHDFRPRFFPWAVFIDRLFVQPIARRTMATFKAIAEAVADDTSTPDPPTNLPS